MNTNYFFKPGKLSIVMDQAFGSSGKACIASFLTDKADNWQFACNAFSAQAGHWVKLLDGKTYFYQTFNSCAYQTDKYEKLFIGPDAAIELPALHREIEENNIPPHKIGIHPLATIVQEKDMAYERGEVNFDGEALEIMGDGTKLGGSTCLNKRMVVETEIGPRTIKWIVDNKYIGKVLSMNKNGVIEYKSIIGHRSMANNGKKWVKIGPNTQRKQLICTTDHLCASIDDILNPDIKYTQAKDMLNKWVAINKNDVREHRENALYNKDQISAIIGSLFGDSSLHRNTLTCEHSNSQKEYFEFKLKLFKGSVQEFNKHTLMNSKNSFAELGSKRLNAPINAQTKFLRSIVYNGSKKTIKNILQYLNEVGLAFWYMDDGTRVERSKSNRSDYAVFCTDSFSKSDIYETIVYLKEKFDINASLCNRNRIHLTVDGSRKLWGLIAKYVVESMDYKIPKGFRTQDKYNYNFENLDYGAQFISEIYDIKDNKWYKSDLYDIEVEDNHNFFANGFLVHNCHGIGPARVRKMLRRKDTYLAKDEPSLASFICDVSSEIIGRLDKGQAGLLEIAQGFPLSLNYKFYPHCTNRNCTVSAALDGMFLPPIYAGNLLLNCRTFPIRINSRKFIDENNNYLKWDEVQEYDRLGKKYTVYEGNSGHWYEDQTEVDWDYVTKFSGSPDKLFETTSVTGLPRRVATFSKQNLAECIKFNRTGHDTYISVNFANYVDYSIYGAAGDNSKLTSKVIDWINENITPTAAKYDAILKFIGTGPCTEHKIVL